VSIITHEPGHQLGLNHSPQQAATMFAAYVGGNAPASLAADDIEGVCTLYPSGAAPLCRDDAECGGGQSCIGGECVDPPPAGAGLGDPCGPGGCAEGFFCVLEQDGSDLCTRDCGAGCPQGWACERIRFGNRGDRDVCWPDEDGGGEGAAFGAPCQRGQDCASGFCVSNGREAFCTQACSQDGDCPQGAECVGTQGGGGACLPGAGGDPDPNARGFGEACEDHGECVSMICVGTQGGGGFCTELCDQAGDCPDGAGCQETTNGQGVCVPREGDGQYGDPCDGGQDCDSELCLDDGQRSFCSERCSDLGDCPPGSEECVQTNLGGACVPGDDPPPPPPEEDANVPVGDPPTLDAAPGNGGRADAGSGNMFVDAATGRLPQAEAGPSLVETPPPQDGCHCSTTPTEPAPLPWLVAVALLGWRVRRRLRG
jgi:MYXO-CTERM domain-containing protein